MCNPIDLATSFWHKYGADMVRNAGISRMASAGTVTLTR